MLERTEPGVYVSHDDSPAPAAEAALRCLQDIEMGRVMLNDDDVRYAASTYCEVVHYRASNGWEFWVFNDCDEWDYLEAVMPPNTEISMEYMDMPDWLQDWQPNVATAVRIWGLSP
jgi:hypothetical protein